MSGIFRDFKKALTSDKDLNISVTNHTNNQEIQVYDITADVSYSAGKKNNESFVTRSVVLEVDSKNWVKKLAPEKIDNEQYGELLDLAKDLIR